MLEHFFQCPHCWETISFLIDTSVGQQQYIEDCEVCCNPIQVKTRFSAGELIEFQADTIDQ